MVKWPCSRWPIKEDGVWTKKYQMISQRMYRIPLAWALHKWELELSQFHVSEPPWGTLGFGPRIGQWWLQACCGPSKLDPSRRHFRARPLTLHPHPHLHFTSAMQMRMQEWRPMVHVFIKSGWKCLQVLQVSLHNVNLCREDAIWIRHNPLRVLVR